MNSVLDERACQVSSFFAACTPKSRFPECSCPVGQNIQKPDPYDDTKYLVCNNGDRYIFQCPENEVYFPDTEECNTPPTTTTTTTTTSGCPATEIAKIKVNCTCYRFCFGESNTYRDECCDPGEIYMEDTEKCEFYYPFSCSGKTDGRYVDTQNCSVYHICVSNSTFATLNCNDGEVFDEATQSCTTGTICNALVDCGICPDDKTFIKIDCYK
ncbi:hypothetical protein Avbf_10584 [Armadillidium vulgare]|nr:hypothetical protein Avbf_10584 [Armadillidium vulgare]